MKEAAVREIERLNAVILAHIENENRLYGEIRSLRDQIIEECAKAAETAAWEGDIDNVLIAIRSLSHKKD